ncbi:hypothetical protein C0Z18_31735 [Trinickia dabaoshanensis]|uniref:Uncharacterized protein n=1 Tax=Trinickia dabaoshanensis TaxID=564714 RepID=A0A2N7VBA1_9BURK|nr:hypothetical protein C0Z18_31735 [Trinickia dabaoshanensis]
MQPTVHDPQAAAMRGTIEPTATTATSLVKSAKNRRRVLFCGSSGEGDAFARRAKPLSAKAEICASQSAVSAMAHKANGTTAMRGRTKLLAIAQKNEMRMHRRQLPSRVQT